MEGATSRGQQDGSRHLLMFLPPWLLQHAARLHTLFHAGWTAEKDMYHHREEHFTTAARERRGMGRWP